MGALPVDADAQESTDTISVSFSATMSDGYSIFSGGDDISINETKRSIRFKHFFDANPSFLCIVDMKGCFKKINSTFLNAMGYVKKEMYNKLITDIIYVDKKKLGYNFANINTQFYRKKYNDDTKTDIYISNAEYKNDCYINYLILIPYIYDLVS